ncbi:hypothetical protein POL68_33770 [Stigmatella sp. ncwal1]|uniref:Secreted protein n=1 Tax=Stigmatella ashevillensis TaxID=2995309 RepID=A0ABT5DIK9_9BACT|nr:hypothetical protein [Stigmatella ashevillena]MDC0713482.1 hypothetical protein [Stigmatella ashevillena]
MRMLAVGPLAWVLACVGPPAPDAALCQDVLSRVCLARSCPGVSEQLGLGSQECFATLEARTGCGTEAFVLTEPSRERLLVCRQPLVRRSTDPGKAPTCGEMAEVVRDCPDLTAFLRGSAP